MHERTSASAPPEDARPVGTQCLAGAGRGILPKVLRRTVTPSIRSVRSHRGFRQATRRRGYLSVQSARGQIRSRLHQAGRRCLAARRAHATPTDSPSPSWTSPRARRKTLSRRQWEKERSLPSSSVPGAGAPKSEFQISQRRTRRSSVPNATINTGLPKLSVRRRKKSVGGVLRSCSGSIGQTDQLPRCAPD